MERMNATNPVEALSSEVVVYDMPGLKVSSVEVTPAVPTTSRSPRPKKTMAKEKQPATKEKQSTAKEKLKKLVLVCVSPRKHIETQQRRKRISSQKE